MSKQKVLQAMDDLHNGNLTDAKMRLKKVSHEKVIEHLSRSYTMEHSIVVAAYLKGKISFENYCTLTRNHLD